LSDFETWVVSGQYDDDMAGETDPVEYTINDVGCYFDGAFGFEFNAGRIIDLAIEHGYAPHFQAENGEDEDALAYEMESAEEYLNEMTDRPDSTFWSWQDGDFGLWLYCDNCSEVINPSEQCSSCEEVIQ
jgi:hypothetical protein